MVFVQKTIPICFHLRHNCTLKGFLSSCKRAPFGVRKGPFWKIGVCVLCVCFYKALIHNEFALLLIFGVFAVADSSSRKYRKDFGVENVKMPIPDC